MFSIDDATSGFTPRFSARKNIDEQLAKTLEEVFTPVEPEEVLVEESVQTIQESQEDFYARRDRELRATWGKTPEQVAEMNAGFSI